MTVNIIWMYYTKKNVVKILYAVKMMHWITKVLTIGRHYFNCAWLLTSNKYVNCQKHYFYFYLIVYLCLYQSNAFTFLKRKNLNHSFAPRKLLPYWCQLNRRLDCEPTLSIWPRLWSPVKVNKRKRLFQRRWKKWKENIVWYSFFSFEDFELFLG